MNGDKIIFAVFTGTGNTLVAAKALAAHLEKNGKTVEFIPMDKPPAEMDKNAVLGLAVPVACFTSYPTVWRFIDALPDGDGRESFFLATMGGMGGGMQGPIGQAILKKNYRLIGAKCIAMGANYGSGIPVANAAQTMYARTRQTAEKYGDDLLAGRARWSTGWWNPIAPIMAWLGRRKTSFRKFQALFPLNVDQTKCVGCGLCEKMCPENNISMSENKARIGDNCQSCQRCVGFCPSGAIAIPGKPANQYKAVPTEEMKNLLKI